MYVFNVYLDNDTMVEIYADYAESAERIVADSSVHGVLFAECAS